MKSQHVAIVGATGAVGQQILRLLEERNFPIASLKLLSSTRSAGTKVVFCGQEYIIEEAVPQSFEGIDIALFAAGTSVSKLLVPEAVKCGAIVIDNTNAFRMDKNTPLIVPEVNMDDANLHNGVIANPNCSTIQMVVALKPLHDQFKIKRIIVSTYQAVSGAGNQAITELYSQTQAILQNQEIKPDILPVGSLPVKHTIGFNVIPQIDVFQENGFTTEEMKMVLETQKILGDSSIQVTATCVRVPVVNGHSESIYVEFENDFELTEVNKLLAEAPGVIIQDDPGAQLYPLAQQASGNLNVFVGRIRRDLYHEKGLNMWVVSDNLLKGAAWNAVQIAEQLIQTDYSTN